MWLHKHGWKYFESNIEEIYSGIKSEKAENFRTEKIVPQLKKILEELIRHLSVIESEIKKEDNMLKKLETAIYEVHLVNKIRNKHKLDDYENGLADRFRAVEYSYLELKKDVIRTWDICNNGTSGNMNTYTTFINEIAGITNALHDIGKLSSELGAYLGKALPLIEDYEEWITTEQQRAEWVENNIKSWISSETNHK